MYSGERILPQHIFNVTYQQSLVAYEFSRQYVKGKNVLDVACGEGYGLSLLAPLAEKAVGVDYNQGTVAHAQATYKQANLFFRQGNLLELPSLFPDEQFDVICCFQTIEHIQDHDAFFTALKSVLAPGGVVIVSTPNKHMFPSFNPYHVHEVDRQELEETSKRHFSVHEMYGVFGDDAVMKYRASKQKVADIILALDIFHLRSILPSWLLKSMYGFISLFVIKRISFWKHAKEVKHITTDHFSIRQNNLETALDFMIVAKNVSL